MRAVFFGTPELAVPSLDALLDVASVEGVVCQPDRPAGRGLALTPPPVKVRAQELGLTVIQPTKLKTGEVAEWVRALQADVALVVAYGRILPPDVLAATSKGFVNVHASLLPKYRGAAPITWSIVRGEAETGVTLMVLDAGMDTGPVLSQRRIPILPDETAAELGVRIAALGAMAVRADLARFVAGSLPSAPQDESLATLAPLLDTKAPSTGAEPPSASTTTSAA
jgi:methionyl-tRNA formyltransferase